MTTILHATHELNPYAKRSTEDSRVKRVIGGLKPGSTDTKGYCRARGRLPETMISTLARQAGRIIAKGAAGWWQWQGRQVRLVDGATLTLADTKKNQEAYPQSNSQKPGLGFPICRLVALLCLASGALLDAAVGPCKGKGGDEQTLLREMLDTLQSGDILLGDSYFLLWEPIRGGVDGVFEQYGANLDGLAATRWRHPRRGLHPRLTGADCRTEGRIAPRANRTTRSETAGKAVSIAYQTEAGSQGVGSRKWVSEKAALNLNANLPS